MTKATATMTDDIDPNRWITTSEAAELTGYGMARFRQLASQGKVEGQKSGRDWFLEKSSVLEGAEQMRHVGSAKQDPWRGAGRQKIEEKAYLGLRYERSDSQGGVPAATAPRAWVRLGRTTHSLG